MKKFKKTFMAVALLSMSVATAFAQATYTDAENNEYQFKKHAFLNLQGGAQYTLGESLFSTNYRGVGGSQRVYNRQQLSIAQEASHSCQFYLCHY